LEESCNKYSQHLDFRSRVLFSTNIYENLPNKTSFPGRGFDGIFNAKARETSAIIAPA
jgi:hypothetical protein